jgi:hypothetical protein
MALEHLTKDNFVDHPPFFTVYDYWYNLVVDKVNELSVIESTLDGTTVTLTSTDAGATAAPEVCLYRNSATPAALDVLGQITFDGEDSVGNAEEYARIQTAIADPTSTTEDGAFQVYAKTAGAMQTLPNLQVTGSSLGVTREADGAEGAALQLNQVSASPAASDAVGMVKFVGLDSGAASQEYAQIAGVISDPTAASEDGIIEMKVAVAGTVTKVAEFNGAGLSITANGAIGAPSLTIGGNADTGLYEVSGVQTGFSQDGVLIFMTNSGKESGTGAFQADAVVPMGPLGSTPVATVEFEEYGDGHDYTTVLTLTDFIVGALAGAAAALGVGNIVYAFPAGQHIELASSFSSLVLTAAGTAVTTDTGLGSVIASGIISALNGTATFEDRLTGQAIDTAAGGGAAVSALKAPTAGVLTGIGLNVAASVKNVFLNSAGTWNANNTGNLTASGTIVLKWTRM